MNIRRTSLLLGSIACLLGSIPAAQAQDLSPDEKSCKQFVQTFYNWYTTMEKRGVKGDPLTVALKQKKSNFDATLVQQIKEDEAASARNGGEVVGLDFDPVLNAQDMCDKYTVGKVTKKDANYLVDVYGHWTGKKESKPDVTPELSKRNGQWTFVNFHYGKSDIADNENLISVLKVLKKDRQKNGIH